jgi:PKD repeat protein
MLGASLAVLLVWAATAAATESLAVTAVPLTLTEGQSYNGPVATFIDSAIGDSVGSYTASIAWGDGATSPGTVFGSDANGWTVSATHLYQEEGTYTISTTVNDSAGPATGSVAQNVTVADAPLSASQGSTQQFSGTGTPGALNSEQALEAGIGGINNGTAPSEQSSGLRVLKWDAISTDGTDALGATTINAHTVALSPSRVQASGLRLKGPVAVANDGFQSTNAGTGTKLQAFTSPNLAAPFNSNTLELDVVAPTRTTSAAVPQVSRGLGVVFKNVVSPNTTSIEYFNGDTLLSRIFAPAGAAGQPEFAGELFGSPVVTKVVITLGTAMIFSWDGNFITAGPTDGGAVNLVAADDVVLAEPAPPHAAASATAGVVFSGTVGTFADSDPVAAAHDFTSEIDWGDGSVSSGSVSGSGPFAVGGSHTYAASGTFTVKVNELDLGGAERSESFTMTVAPRASTTSVSCAPAAVHIGQAATCAATVTDTGSSPSAPTGAVTFGSDTTGGGFGSGAGCTLVATSTAGQSSCTITYVPGLVGSGTHEITGTYNGDAARGGSSGTGALTVSAAPGVPGAPSIVPRCTMAIPSKTLAKHARTFRVTVSCNLAANLNLTGVATLAPKHSRKRSRLNFGTAHALAPAGRAVSLTLKPSSKVLAQIRKAAHQGAHITLSFSVIATNRGAIGASNASVPVLKVAR